MKEASEKQTDKIDDLIKQMVCEETPVDEVMVADGMVRQGDEVYVKCSVENHPFSIFIGKVRISKLMSFVFDGTPSVYLFEDAELGICQDFLVNPSILYKGWNAFQKDTIDSINELIQESKEAEWDSTEVRDQFIGKFRAVLKKVKRSTGKKIRVLMQYM